MKNPVSRIALGILVGIPCLYIPAVAWLSLSLHTGYLASMLAMAPYALFDIGKVVLAEFIARKAERVLSSD